MVVETHIQVSRGADLDDTSGFTTTYANQYCKASKDLPYGNKAFKYTRGMGSRTRGSGYGTNNRYYIGPNQKRVKQDIPLATTKSTYGHNNSIHGEKRGYGQSAERHNHAFPSGTVNNLKPYIETQHHGLNNSPHKSVYKSLRKSNPIDAENDGKGPLPMTTQSSITYTKKPQHTGRNPIDKMEIYDHSMNRKQAEAGYELNLRNSKIAKEGLTTLTNEELSPSYYNSNPYQSYYKKHYIPEDIPLLSSKEANTLKSMGLQKPVNHTNSGYAKCSFAVGKEYTSSNVNEFNYPDYLHPSTEKSLKVKDPVEYHTFKNRDPYATATKATINANSLKYEQGSAVSDLLSKKKDANFSTKKQLVDTLSGFNTKNTQAPKKSGFGTNISAYHQSIRYRSEPLSLSEKQKMQAKSSRRLEYEGDENLMKSLTKSTFTHPGKLNATNYATTTKISGFSRSIVKPPIAEQTMSRNLHPTVAKIQQKKFFM